MEGTGGAASCNKVDSTLNMGSLNKLFAPSDWSKRYPTPEQVINQHIKFTKTGKNGPELDTNA